MPEPLLRRASAAERAARKASSPADRKQLLEIAAYWRRLAREAEAGSRGEGGGANSA